MYSTLFVLYHVFQFLFTQLVNIQWWFTLCKIYKQYNFEKSFMFLTWEGDFPHNSVGKESACNAGDPSSIPGWGRYAAEGIGYPLQYSWASLVAQLMMNLPAMQETCDLSLGWEDPLEKGKAMHSSILAWRIPWTIQSMGSQRVRHDWATLTFQ